MGKYSKVVTGLGAATCMAFASAASADVVRIDEGFNGAGIPAGWVLNPAVSATIPVTWQKPINVGTGGVFPAQAGAPDSYLFNSFNSTPTSANRIDDYLITPTFLVNNGATVSFFVKADPTSEASFPDRLRVLLSTSGASTATSAFTFLLGDINPTYSPAGFPTDWTMFTFTVNGLATGSSFVTGRLAFEYLIDNTDTHGNFIGLDTVRVAVTVPEPDSLLLTSIGLVALGLGARRARKAAVRA